MHSPFVAHVTAPGLDARANLASANPANAANTRDADLLRRAMAIADEQLAVAEPDARHSITWRRGYGRDMQPVDDAGLFNGRIGEAFVFAALYAATHESRYADGARLASHTLRQRILDPAGRAALLREVPIGLVGAGSMMYAFLRMAEWLEAPEWRELSTTLLASITPEMIESDVQLDMFWGSAGLLHAALALHEAGIDGALSLATSLGDTLVRKRVIDRASRTVAWRTLGPTPWAGFAHGSAGIASAVARLYGVVPEVRYADAALQAFAFERSIHDPETGDWPDARDVATHISGWCHGAPGIALSRLSAVETLDGDLGDVVGDLDAALTRTCRDPVGRPDNLCCGNFGRVDILLEAAHVIDNDSLREHARAVARLTIEQMDVRGPLLGSAGSDGPHMRPGFWQGHIGIAYGLLRLADDRRWPCVLRLA